IRSAAGKNNASGAIDQQSGSISCKACIQSFLQITTLCANSWNEQGHIASYTANGSQLFRICGAHHQRKIAVAIPAVVCPLCNDLVQRLTLHTEGLQFI